MTIIETTHTNYSELFKITLLHGAYEMPLDHFLAENLSIVPDESTKQLFTEYKLNYRFFNNTLICFVQSVLFAPPAPFMTIDGTSKIRFLVKINSDFYLKTFVTAQAQKKIYQFSNKTLNTTATETFLTAPVENFNPANDYSQGTIVSDGTNLFGALQTALAANSIPITNTNFWDNLSPLEQVVSNADLQDASVVKADEDCLAVIDMYKSVSTPPYRFFDTSDKILDPVPSFTIKFKSTLKF
jgi:hypothetical protein